VRHAEELSKCFLLTGLGQSGITYANTRASEYAIGIMRRFGHQFLARDSLEELEHLQPNPGTKEGFDHHFLKPIRCEYHFDSFIIFTKSNFDFIAHLINEVLQLASQGRNVDLAREEFRAKISKACPVLGATIDYYDSWIKEITKYRTAIEHQKVLPLGYFNLDELHRTHFGMYRPNLTKSVLRFPEPPMTFWESLSKGKRRYKTRPVLPYCDSSLRKTQEIVEKTFQVACEILQKSKPVVKYRQARERAIRSSYEDIDPVGLKELGEINIGSLKQYLTWKFPKREQGIGDTSVESSLLKELHEGNIGTFEQPDKMIDQKIEWFLEYERTHPVFQSLGSWDSIMQAYTQPKRTDYNSIGIARAIVQETLRETSRPRNLKSKIG